MDVRSSESANPCATNAPRSRRLRRASTIGGVLATMLVLSGCSDLVERGFLPKGVTSNTDEITRFWNATWLWALGVGVLVWGLIFWCVARYRRKKTDTGLPPQMQYNVPLEILYTVVPVFMVAVLFGKTVELENQLIGTDAKPDVTINVVGKQWSWDFNYIGEQAYDTGVQGELTGRRGVEASLPTLYLPINRRVEFVLTARDVIHSFWVPQFLQKLDMIPGRVNRFQVVPTEIGTFKGKCAELCGAYHSEMLFNVKVVSQADYDKHIAQLKAKGQTGYLSNSLNRSGIERREQQYLPQGVEGSMFSESENAPASEGSH